MLYLKRVNLISKISREACPRAELVPAQAEIEDLKKIYNNLPIGGEYTEVFEVYRAVALEVGVFAFVRFLIVNFWKICILYRQTGYNFLVIRGRIKVDNTVAS